jgi:pilus assembly protein CpaF
MSMAAKDTADIPPPSPADFTRLKKYLIENLSRAIEAEGITAHQRSDFIKGHIQEIYEKAHLKLPEEFRNKILSAVLNELLGYGPIQPLLDDADVSEVMVNGSRQIYIERNGRLEKTDINFDDDAHVLQIIDRIVSPLGRRIGPGSPMVDARLPDGSRVNAIVPPVAIDGPSITIRKFQKDKMDVRQLIEFGSLTDNMAEFLHACVLAKLNIIISGGTGSGKTTFLNVLTSNIPESERIVTIEDAAELQLQQEHVVRLETKSESLDGDQAVSIRDLVRNALRMRPDRIIVGEVRGGEALDMLQAMNTGHDGSMTTLHANNPRDALSRLETMILMAGIELPLKVVRQQIASAVDLIIQQSRLKDGSRKVTAITEVAGMESDTIILTDIFHFEQTNITQEGKVLGDLKPTGIRPLFSTRLEASGFKLKPEIFGVSVADILKPPPRR